MIDQLKKIYLEEKLLKKFRYNAARLCISIFLLAGLCVNETSLAKNGDPMGFNVKAITPEKQIDLNKTYFYIKTEPSQQQTLKVDVTNNEEKEITIETTAANAITGPNGKISYISGMEDKDKTLQNSVEELVSIEPSELVLQKGETKQVVISVTPPPEHYKGIKLGTLYFQKKGEDKASTGQINSEYRYAIDLVMSEGDEPIYGGKDLTLDSAEATLMLREKVIALQFSNADPKVIQDLNITTQIMEKGNDKVLKSAKIENGRMAPNSHFTFEVPWGLETFKPGTYEVKTKASSNTDEWEFLKEFTITADQAKKMNSETATKLRFEAWIYEVFIGNILLFIGLTFILTLRQRKWKKEVIRIRRKKKRKKRA